MSRRTRAQVVAGIEAVHSEGAGAIRLDTVMVAEVPDLFGAAARGDRHARTLACLLEQTCQQVKAAPRDQPVLCAGCPEPIRDKVAGFVLVTGLRDDPARALGFCICERCGPTADAVQAVGAAAARKYWPDLHPFTLAPGGCA